MPASGPVYQPTTVSYEIRPGLLSQTASASPLIIFKKPIRQIILLIFSLLAISAGSYENIKSKIDKVLLNEKNFFYTGITMIVNGAVDYEDTEEHKEELELNTSQAETRDIGVVIGGILVTIVGFIGLGLYVVVADWRCNYVCPCILSKKQGLARQLQGQSGGQIMAALNPSTDPLVSHTQYAPVSELPRPDDEECRTLMPGDNKDW